MGKFTNRDLVNYLLAKKNPLDKKYRWEVNTAFKNSQITENERVALLKIKDKDLKDLVDCIERKIAIDKKQVGNYYYKRALYLYRQRQKYAKKPLDFSGARSSF